MMIRTVSSAGSRARLLNMQLGRCSSSRLDCLQPWFATDEGRNLHRASTIATTTRLFSAIPSDPDPQFVNASNAPSDFVATSAVVYPEFISETQAEILVQELLVALKRRRYEKGHWDAVITKYKETELLDEDAMFSVESQTLLRTVRDHLAKCHIDHDDFTWLPCHCIDLHKEGQLNAHVDSIKFSGGIVSGLSLLSPAIMRLVPDNNDSDVHAHSAGSKDEEDLGWVDLYLPPLSLYALSGVSRYKYSHQLLPSGSAFSLQAEQSVTVDREHRLSVIFRDAKEQS